MTKTRITAKTKRKLKHSCQIAGQQPPWTHIAIEIEVDKRREKLIEFVSKCQKCSHLVGRLVSVSF